MIPTKDEGRAATDRAAPDTYYPRHDTPTRIRALIVGAALGLQRIDVAVIAAALALAGWPR